MKFLKRVLLGLVLLSLIGSAYFTWKAHNPSDLPAFPACPDSPNCVSSLVPTGSEHYIEPLVLSGGLTNLDIEPYKAILLAPKRSKIVAESVNSVVVSYHSRVFGFEDRLEVHFTGKVASVRSASRVGHYDFGVNRKRVEALREAFIAVGK